MKIRSLLLVALLGTTLPAVAQVTSESYRYRPDDGQQVQEAMTRYLRAIIDLEEQQEEELERLREKHSDQERRLFRDMMREMRRVMDARQFEMFQRELQRGRRVR